MQGTCQGPTQQKAIPEAEEDIGGDGDHTVASLIEEEDLQGLMDEADEQDPIPTEEATAAAFGAFDASAERAEAPDQGGLQVVCKR